MRIGIDCRLAGKGHAGIGRYIENLITRLPEVDRENTFILFFYSKKQAEEIDLDRFDNVKIVIVPISHYSVLEQLVLPLIYFKAKLDLLHVPHFNIPIFYFGKTVITIHDLLWHQQKGLQVTTLPAWLYLLKYWAYLFTTSVAVSRADKIMVPSEVIKKTVTKFYPQQKDKIKVTKEGIDQTFIDLLATKVVLKASQDKYLLYVGSLYPHKNIDLVLRSLVFLPLKLKIVGSRNVFLERTKKLAQKYQVEHKVEFLGFVPDKELAKLYQNSLALVQPSLSEGFGLTGIEAMAAGTLVICSNIPVFVEIYQQAALYFDPQSLESFIKVASSLKNVNRQLMIKEGRQLCQKYDWREMTRQTLAVYQQVLGKR